MAIHRVVATHLHASLWQPRIPVMLRRLLDVFTGLDIFVRLLHPIEELARAPAFTQTFDTNFVQVNGLKPWSCIFSPRWRPLDSPARR